MSRKGLYKEMKNLKRFIYFIKVDNITSQEKNTKDFLNEIISDKYTNLHFKIFLNNLLFIEKIKMEIKSYPIYFIFY